MKHNKNSTLVISSVALVSIGIIVTGLMGSSRIHQELERAIPTVKQAPVNTDAPSGFTWLTGSFETHELKDTLLPVTCHGHRMLRIVQQYIKPPGQSTLMPIPIPKDILDNTPQFPIHSAQIFNKYQQMHGVFIRTEIIENDFYQDYPQALSVTAPLPQNIHVIDHGKFFIGADPAQPQEKNISIDYVCQHLHPITLWGAIDNEHHLSDSFIGSGLSALPLAKQKTQLIKTLEYSFYSLTTLGCLLITLLLLVTLKAALPYYPFRRLRTVLEVIQRYQIWLIIPIVFLPNSVPIAIVIGCIGTFYFGLLKITGLLKST